MNNEGHILVDLDGTLAYYDRWHGPQHIGEPIPLMAERVHNWLKEGIEVKIFTARATEPEKIPYIKDWLIKHGFGDLEVTNAKDFKTIEIWDDRAVHVNKNTGELI